MEEPVLDYYSAEQVARTFNVSSQTIRTCIHNGTLPAIKIGGLYRIHRLDLEAWLEAARYVPANKSDARSERARTNSASA